MSTSFLRNVIGEYMTTLEDKNDRVVIVNADLAGTCRNTNAVEKYPMRAYNVGIAEQNMVAFAAGIACEGFIPFVFSMAPFLVMRACEQVRTDVAYGKKNVKLIGVYAGLSGGISGVTHWAIEDIGIMSSIPWMTIFEVSDANLARRIMDYSVDQEGPIYIRCGVEPTRDLYDSNIDVQSAGSIVVHEGDDACILCSGVIVQYALEAVKQIEQESGKRVRVVDMYSIKPIDNIAIEKAVKTGHIIVAQDHNIVGGLGSIVATQIAQMGVSIDFKILGLNDEFIPMAHAPFLYDKYHLDANGLRSEMIKMLEGE
jgi:transketolase